MSQEKTEDSAPREQQDSGDLSPLVSEVAGALWSVFRSGGKALAQSGRERLEGYQAKKDLQKLYEKLGRETCRLVEAGEITHPGLQAGATRIEQQRQAVARAEAEAAADNTEAEE